MKVLMNAGLKTVGDLMNVHIFCVSHYLLP